MLSCRRENAGADTASNSCNMPDTYMQIKNSAPSGEVTFFTDKNLHNPLGTVGSGIPVIRQLTSETNSASLSLTSSSGGLDLTDDTEMQIKQSLGNSGAWITTDLNRSNNLGYVAGGIPVIRQLTQNTSSGAKVARIDIRGGSLANKVGWASYSDLEPRGGGSTNSASNSPASSSSNSSTLKVMRAEIRGGSLANKVGWTLADNLEPRACQARAKAQQCTGNTISDCDSTGCKCVDTGRAPESVVGSFIIDSLAGFGAGGILKAAAGRAAAAVAEGAASGVSLITAEETIPTAGKSAYNALLAEDKFLKTVVGNLKDSGNLESAMERIKTALSNTNPMSKLGKTGGGNCANDALTQITALVTGRWACAIPYPVGGSHGNWEAIVQDAENLFGKLAHFDEDTSVDLAKNMMERNLSEGGIVLLKSQSAQGSHATFVIKINGQLVPRPRSSDHFKPLYL